VSPSSETILGYRLGDLVGRNAIEFIYPDDLESTRNQMRRARLGGLKSHFETRYVHKDGRIVTLTWTGVWSEPEQRHFFIGRDMTARRRAEDEIRRLNEELEARVRQRTAELMAANQELEAFSYSVSHDLRAPLRAIDGFSRILLEDHAAQLSDDATHSVQVVRRNAQQMGRLIDDLLAFSRLGRQSPKAEPVPLKDVAERIIAELHADCAGREIEIAIGELGIVQADPALLKQALVNLLSNAIKFTRNKDRARIEFGRRDDPENGPVYFVRDNGAGFDMRYADKLFSVFQRLHRAEEYEGTGVGLAIVQRVIRRHGGRVWADAKVGEGATFYFTLKGVSGNDAVA
jgi:PAS domain S-box-containing protein